MYENSPKKIKIDWKSLIIKIIILLLVLCLLIWIISLFKKDKKVSNISDNLTIMKEAAAEYFVASKLPTKVNDKVKLTLGEMIKEKLVIEFKDQNGKTCNNKESYAEVTKINDQDYSLKVKLVCSKDSDYIIDTISVPVEDNPTTPSEEDKTDTDTETNKPVENNGTTSNKPSTNNNVNQNNKPNNNSTPNTKPSNNDNASKPNPTPSCAYGSSEYTSIYPLAYVIGGNCAVSFNDYYNATYANKVSEIGAVEYNKLSNEIMALANETGTSLYVESPIYSGVYNKANTGLVGYQIMMVAKLKDTYNTKVIYEYYLDETGNRQVVFDNRGSLYNNSEISNK